VKLVDNKQALEDAVKGMLGTRLGLIKPPLKGNRLIRCSLRPHVISNMNII